MGFEEAMDAIARGVEVLRIVTLVLGLAAALVRAGLALVGGQGANEGYRIVRTVFGRSILLGLEFLVAADIIRTVAVQPSLENVAVLGADRADQDVPELLVGGGDRWSLALAACGGGSVDVVDPIARQERARRLVTWQAAGCARPPQQQLAP
jgi:uncharacterized membrane protein